LYLNKAMQGHLAPILSLLLLGLRLRYSGAQAMGKYLVLWQGIEVI